MAKPAQPPPLRIASSHPGAAVREAARCGEGALVQTSSTDRLWSRASLALRGVRRASHPGLGVCGEGWAAPRAAELFHSV